MSVLLRARRIPSSLVVLVAVLAGCGGGSSGAPPAPSPTTSARPSSTARLEVVKPTNGDQIRGPTVHLSVRLSGARIVPYTSTDLKPDEGHLHLLLDGRLISMTLGVEQDIPDVAAGAHVIRVEFVANDHAPFTPRVVREVTFQVT